MYLLYHLIYCLCSWCFFVGLLVCWVLGVVVCVVEGRSAEGEISQIMPNQRSNYRMSMRYFHCRVFPSLHSWHDDDLEFTPGGKRSIERECCI